MTSGPFYQPPSNPPPPTPPPPPQGGNGGSQSTPPFDALTEWLRGEGEANDVVLSSRVRLARNLAGAPFAAKASRRDRLATLEACRNQVLRAGVCDRLAWIDLHEAPVLQRSLLVERHLISKQHSKGRPVGIGAGEDPRGVAVS